MPFWVLLQCERQKHQCLCYIKRQRYTKGKKNPLEFKIKTQQNQSTCLQFLKLCIGKVIFCSNTYDVLYMHVPKFKGKIDMNVK